MFDIVHASMFVRSMPAGKNQPDDDPSRFAEQVRSLRGELGIRRQDFAEKLGVTFQTIYRWESGAVAPSPLALEKLRKLETELESPSSSRPIELADSQVALDFTGNPVAIRAVVEGERLTSGHLHNPLFGTEISKIDPLPHQHIAVYQQLLPQPRLRFLLADDAGAGKTIMTGLYIKEMLNRRLLRRALIVPPAGLVGN